MMDQNQFVQQQANSMNQCSGLGAGGPQLGAYAQLAQNVIQPEPTVITFQIERMVNGYVVQTTSGAPVKHLVTSREALIELLTAEAPSMLSRPPPHPWTGQPVEEKKW